MHSTTCLGNTGINLAKFDWISSDQNVAVGDHTPFLSPRESRKCVEKYNNVEEKFSLNRLIAHPGQFDFSLRKPLQCVGLLIRIGVLYLLPLTRPLVS